MAYKRYIKVAGKVYGPYEYSSKRKDGKVVSVYHGKEEEKKEEIIIKQQPSLFQERIFEPVKKPSILDSPVHYDIPKKIEPKVHINFKPFIASMFVLLIVLSLFILPSMLTGKIISNIELDKNKFDAGETISGKFNLMLNDGETLSDSTRAVIQIGGETREMSASEFLGTTSQSTTIDLSSLGISFENEGDYNLVISLSNENGTITQTSAQISVKKEKKEEAIGEIIELNESNVTEPVIEVIENITEPIIEENITEIIEENTTESVVEENITEPVIEEHVTIENITKPVIEENKTIEIESITLSNDTIIETNDTAEPIKVMPEKTLQYKVVVGKPVKWEKKVVLTKEQADSKTLIIDIPTASLNIDVKKLIDGTEENVKEAKVNGKDAEDYNGVYVDRLTGQATLEIYHQNFLEKLLNLIKSVITGKAIADVKEVSDVELEKVELEITDSFTEGMEIKIEYETPAPWIEETQLSKNTKQITVSSIIHYEDILASAEIDNVPAEMIKLYLTTDEQRQAVKDINYVYLDDNNLVDSIEWVVPSLSSQTYEIVIEIIKAQHLDSNRNFISDIYEQVKAKDDSWSETINNQEYARVTFEQPLSKTNDITVYARGIGSIEIYEKNKDDLIAAINDISIEGYYKTYLDDLDNEQDTFDLKVLGSIEFDYIVDPFISLNTNVTYVSPTLPDTTAYTKNNWIYVNISSPRRTINQSLLEWQNATPYNSIANITMFNLTPSNWYINITDLTDGVYNYTVWVNDSADGSAANWIQTKRRNVTIDTVAPSVNIIYPANNSYINSTLNVNWASNETLSSIWYSFNSTANISLTSFSADTLLGGTYHRLHSCDLDSDGDMDLITNYEASSTEYIYWHENNGAETFTAHDIGINGVDLYRIDCADVDSDGDLDFLGTYDSNEIAWYENNGTQNFTAQRLTTTALAEKTQGIDFDKDGDIDIVYADSGDLKWYKNDGLQSFTLTAINDTNGTLDFSVVDLDSDGDLDIASGKVVIEWYENNGAMSFAHHTINSSTGVDGNPADIDTADMDRDNDIDIVFVKNDDMTWYENDGSESFTEYLINDGNVGADWGGRDVMQIADIDKDGDNDIAAGKASRWTSPDANWWENNGSGTFTLRNLTGNMQGTNGNLHVIDLDSDSDMDIIFTANNYGYSGGVIKREYYGSPANASNIPVVAGSNTLTISAYDKAGNFNQTTVYFTINKSVLPNVTYVSPTPSPINTSINSTIFIVNISSRQALNQSILELQTPTGIVNYTMSNSTLSNTTRNITLTNLANGVYNYTVYAQYVYGNSGGEYINDWKQMKRRYITIDTIVPSGNIIYPLNTTYTGTTINMQWAANKTLSGAWYQINSSSYKTLSTLASAGAITATSWTTRVSVCDLDSDGNMDVISSYNSNLYWYKNNGAESFTEYDTGADGTGRISCADIDGDENMDIIATSSSTAIAWYKNNGSESFTANSLSTSGQAEQKQAIDFDKDGDTDIVYDETSNLSWYKNDGSQSFALNVINASTSSLDLSIIDFDNDGDLDVVSGGSVVAWYENNGLMSFTFNPVNLSSNFDDTHGNFEIEAIDMDNDSYTDIIAVENNQLAWYDNNGAGSFTRYLINSNNVGNFYGEDIMLIADFDQDSDADIIAGKISYTAPDLDWYENNGSGNFTANGIANMNGNDGGLSVGDLDSDGDTDVLSATNGIAGIVWYKNTRANATSIIISEGTNILELYVKDIAGNINYSKIIFEIDNTPSFVKFGIGTEENSAWKKRDWIYVNVSIIETDEANITFTLYNTTLVNSTLNSTPSQRTINWTHLIGGGLKEGAYYYNVTAYDVVGNRNYTETRTIYLDRTSPNVTFSCTPLTGDVNYVITCSCTSGDNLGTPAISYTLHPSTSSAGTKITTCSVADDAGNANSSSLSYTVTQPSGGEIPPITPPCTPSCSGKECGDNGCGGLCGVCSAGKSCSAGSCVIECTPSCSGKECGDNGCGGSCGVCSAGELCSAGSCVLEACTPNWQYGEWSACELTVGLGGITGSQIRTNTDLAECEDSQTETQECTLEQVDVDVDVTTVDGETIAKLTNPISGGYIGTLKKGEREGKPYVDIVLFEPFGNFSRLKEIPKKTAGNYFIDYIKWLLLILILAGWVFIVSVFQTCINDFRAPMMTGLPERQFIPVVMERMKKEAGKIREISREVKEEIPEITLEKIPSAKVKGLTGLELELFKIKEVIRQLAIVEKERLPARKSISLDSEKERIKIEIGKETKLKEVRITESRELIELQKELMLLEKELGRLRGIRIENIEHNLNLEKEKIKIKEEIKKKIRIKEAGIAEPRELTALEKELMMLKKELERLKAIKISDIKHDLNLDREKQIIKEKLGKIIHYQEIEVEESEDAKKLTHQLKKLREELDITDTYSKGDSRKEIDFSRAKQEIDRKIDKKMKFKDIEIEESKEIRQLREEIEKIRKMLSRL